MEDNKYYTPSIEEFHIGFEYEWLDEYNVWNKENSTTEISIKGFKEQNYGLRVKYLNKEDIESLKFLPVIPFNVINKDEYIVNYWVMDKRKPSLQIIECYPYNNHKYNISFGEYEYSKTLFEGIIKNVSELKVLLNKINKK